MSTSLKIFQNDRVSHIFMRMVLELIDKHHCSIDTKEQLSYHFEKLYNVKLNFDSLSLTFSNEKDLMLAIIKYD